MKIQLVVLVVLAALAVLTAGEEFAQVYCGRRLAQTLGAFCSSNLLVKRAGMQIYGLQPWALQGSRGKRQVVSECCMKACTIDELLTYC